MKRPRLITLLTIAGLAAPLLGATLNMSAADAAQSREERRNRSAPGATEKAQKDGGAEWAADPDRGWIRTDEGERSENKQEQKPKQPHGKNKDENRDRGKNK